MRSPSGSLGAHFASETTTLARLMTVNRSDGVVLFLTDHDADITIDARSEAASGTLSLAATAEGLRRANNELIITSGNNALNGETVTIDGKVYTFQTTLTDVDGNVQIGADRRESLNSLAAAINLDTGAGTKYAASTTLHPTVTAIGPQLDPGEFTVSADVLLIASGLGSIISDMNNSAKLFDGDASAIWPTLIARRTTGAASAFGGKDFSASPQRVSRVDLFGSSYGFNGAGTSTTITMELRGADTTFPGATAGTLLGTTTFFHAQSLTASPTSQKFASVTNTDDPTKLWDFLWVILTHSGGVSDYTIAEMQFLEPLLNINPGVDWEGNMGLLAKTAGFAGNLIATTETMVSGSFNTATLTGGFDIYYNALDTETVTIDSKTYTFQDVLTNVDGNVQIGADAEESLGNLIAAINLDAGAGTKYAAATTEHPTVGAAIGVAVNEMSATADATGEGGNVLATTETLSNGSWGAATLLGGFTATYLADPGFFASAALSSSVQGIEGISVTLPEINTVITQDDLNAGVYTNAQVSIEYVNWAAPDDGLMIIFAGEMGENSNDDEGEIEIEIQGKFSRVRQVPVETYGPSCRVDLGDERCQYDIQSERETFTITAVTSQSIFEASITNTTGLTHVDDFWKLGVLRFLTGNNVGVAVEVSSSLVASGEITLFVPAPLPLQVGDTGEIWPGCDKTVNTCRDRFENMINFQGEPFAPSEGNLFAFKG